MSLSRYYPKSSSFQPAEVIKRDEESPTGWQTTAPRDQQPFQTLELPVAAHPKDEIQAPEIPTQNAPTDSTNEIPQGTAPASKQPIASPMEPVIDLSNYLEIELAEKEIDAAYQKGLQDGLQKAKDKIEQDFIDATKTLLNTCQQLETVRETIIGNSYVELQNFALSIAEKIVRISVREQDSTIIATIEEALQRSVKSDEFTVYINPEDYETVMSNSAEMITGLTGLNKIAIKNDITVERGGAKVESDNCTIDATIVGQFDVIREELKKNQ